ncbi:tape measure protein [Yersinia intermedia]|uniref:Phage-related minor tail protein n=1 Tax=Yersinia intermedia TaxID=631 RepID=A0A0T9MTB0_YERIN|nr:tape measure protein [Yersinia intermedia]CNG44151.1 Phage-related minor tail protein [Yersinia intermedia]
MTVLGDLIVNLSANSSSFQSEIARATRLGSDYHRTMESGSRRNNAAINESQQALKALNGQLESTRAIASQATGVLAGVFTIGSLIKTADEWGQLSSRVRMATDSQSQYIDVQQRLMQISDRTYKSIDEQSELFIRSANSMKELGFSTASTIDFIDSISSSLTTNAASTEKGQSAINALSKSMVMGKVAGDQWNTVMEVMPTIIGDIARYLGTTETEVKKLAASGKLSMDTFAKATIAAKDRNAELAEAMPTTIGDAITKLSNHWKAYIGDANAAHGVTQTVSGSISFLADHIDMLAIAGTALAAGGAAKYLTSVGISAGGAARELLKAQKEQIGLADAQLKAAQAAQYKTTLERRAAQAALDVATGTDKQRAATLALVQARKVEEAAINGVAVAQTRLNAITSVAGRIGAGLLSAVGGLPGLAMMAVSAAAGFLLLRDNSNEASKSLADMSLPVDELTKKFRDLGEVQRRSFTDSLRNDIANTDAEIRKSVEAIKIYATQAMPKDLVSNAFGGTELVINAENQQALDRFVATLRDVDSSAGGIKNLQGYMQSNFDAFAKATNMSDEQRQGLQELATAYVESKGKLEGFTERLQAIIGVTKEATAANNGLAASLNVDFSKQLTSAKLALDVSKLAATGAKNEAELLRGAYAAAGEQAELLAPQIQKIVASGGKVDVAPGLEGVREWVQLQSQIIVNNDAAQKLTASIKSGASEAKKLGDAYDKVLQQQNQQIAMHGKEGELAKISYELANGELSALSEAQKLTLTRNAAEQDRLATQVKLKSMMEQLRTPEEQVLETTRARLKLLKEAAPATEDYQKALEKISKASVTEAPKYAGLDASVGGAGSELSRVADAEKELKKWYDKQIDMQKELLSTKEGNEQIYADRVAEINQQNNERLAGIQTAYASATLGVFSSMTGSAADLLGDLVGKSSAAYKAMFVASKAASIAQAVLNTEEAATKAMAQGGMIMGIPMSMAIRAVGYSSIGLMAGTALAGMAHDGIDNVPATGTWLLQKGERVTTAATSAKLDATLGAIQERRETAGGEFNYSPTIQVNGDPDQRTLQMLESAVQRSVQQGYALMVNDLAKGQGKVSKAIGAGWNTKRRAR